MAAELLGAMGLGAGIGSLMDIGTTLLRQGITWAKWHALGESIGKPMMANVMQTVLGAHKSAVTGLDTEGIMSSMFDFIDTSINLGFVLNEQVANALFMHMIQQSVAYAIHQSHGGAVQTICNTYAGSTNLQGMAAAQLSENVDLIDEQSASFLGAASGLNIPSIGFEFFKGANTRIDVVYTRIIQQINAYVDKWNNVALSYYDHYLTMARTRLQEALEMKESILAKAYTLLEKVANEHLTRIAEQIDTISGCNNWYKAKFSTEDELIQICLRISTEEVASEANFDEYVYEITSGIETSLNDWDSYVETALTDIQMAESRYASMIKQMFDTMFSDVDTFVSTILGYVNDNIDNIAAYRGVIKPVSVDSINATGTITPVIQTGVTRLKWKRWIDPPQENIIQYYETPRHLSWVDDKPLTVKSVVVTEAYKLSTAKWTPAADNKFGTNIVSDAILINDTKWKSKT